jgi:predicted CoA-binding protein
LRWSPGVGRRGHTRAAQQYLGRDRTAVDDHDQKEGIGTILIEHLASSAVHSGIGHFVADVLAENSAVLRMIRNLGFVVTSRPEHAVVQLGFDLDTTPAVLAAIDARERQADAASLRLLLAPRSVAVIGADPRPRSVGHEVLRNILDGGFTGAVYVVNAQHDTVLGVPSVGSSRDLPVAPDLAVVAVAAPDVLAAVLECGARGARGVLVLTAGFGETGEAGRILQLPRATAGVAAGGTRAAATPGSARRRPTRGRRAGPQPGHLPR